MSSNEFWDMVRGGYNLVATENGRVVKFQHDTHAAVIHWRADEGLGQIIIEVSEVSKLPSEPLIAPPASHRRDSIDG